MTIITCRREKPGPLRQFDWEAWEEGTNENMIGYGPTEAEALADLRRIWTEEFDWQDWPDEEEEER